MVRLVISDNEGSTTVVPLLRDEVTIGRKEGNTIRLTERNISRRHVQLVRVGGVYKLRDLDSYNGVLVNGRKVEGEAAINNGDQIQVGDYTILVEEEAGARSAPPQGAMGAMGAGAPSPSVAPAALPPEPSVLNSRRPAVPARLVMLTQPASGAEFVLPSDRAARLGRSDEVDCPINHRSVSREHAEIRPQGDRFVIEDLGSANGVTVNGRPVKTSELHSGDIIELGQVVFRYVSAGEHYFFDAGEAMRYRSTAAGKSGANLRLAIVLAAVTVAALVFILLPTPDAPQEDPDGSGTVAAADGENQAEPSGLADDGYDKAVLACRTALAEQRFAEASAHAAMALKARPTAAEAMDCKQRADSQSLDEQSFVRGKDALTRGDSALAYREFASLPATSVFRSRPEVREATIALANSRLEEARSVLPTNRQEAARLAQSVQILPGVSSEQYTLAEQLLAETRGAPPRPQQVAVAPVPAKPAPRPAPAEPAPRPSARPSNPPPPAQPAAQAPARTPSGASAMEIANACLGRGDNECVIRALDGNASSPQELGLLIETYRAIGDTQKAQKNMANYLKRFPSAPRSDAYRRMLELQGQ
jgi:pSer/pThr/pTyr-binding forkhead associated (FHA) protein